MNHKYLIKSIIGIAAAIYISFIFQTAVFPYLALANITPNLLLITTVMFGLFLGAKYGMVVGFLCGLLLDLFLGPHFGMYALIFTYIGLTNGWLSLVFYGDDIKLPLMLVGGTDFVYGLIVYGTMFVFRDKSVNFNFYLTNVLIPEAVYTTIVSMLYYYPMSRLCAWIDKEEKRGTKSFA